MKELENQINLNDENLTSIMHKMLNEMKKGLGKSTNDQAKVKMIPSYVASLPDGTGSSHMLKTDFLDLNHNILYRTYSA